MDVTHPLTRAVIQGNRALTIEETRRCLDAGETANFIIEHRLVPGMAVVGEAFKNNEIFVPEMLIAGRAMKGALALLEPILASAGVKPLYTAIIGTVEGDLHDIGKNLVAVMWKGANIEVIDLGVNVTGRAFAKAVAEYRPNLVGMSALLTTTMPKIRSSIAAIRAAGVPVRIIVGGAPVTAEYAAAVGADGFAPGAGSAVDAALQILAGDH